MSEEKMRASFQEWADKRGVWPMLTHEEIFAAGWQAALQESEAGAVACWRVVDEKGEPQTDWVGGDPVEIDPINKDHKVQFAYLAPPSAQAIETAAIMRAQEVVKNFFDDYESNEMTRNLCGLILALITQDGRTKLAEICLSVAVEVKEA